MRTGARGFPIVIAALLAMAGPVAAADEGEVGVADNIIYLTAEATIDGVSWGEKSNCIYEVAVEDDVAFGVYGADLERLYSDTGRWLSMFCDGEEVVVDGWFVFSEGGAFSEPDLLEQAKRTLDPPSPIWGASPDGVDIPMVVQLPTWLWVDSAYWGANFVARVATPSGRIWAEAQAVPVTTTWSPGDGSTVVCAGPGSEWSVGLEDPDCSHLYRHSTVASDGYPMTMTVEFQVWGSTSLNPGPALLGTVTRTSAPVVVQVGEIQAIESSGV